MKKPALAQGVQNPHHDGRSGAYVFSDVFLRNAGVFRDELQRDELLGSQLERFHHYGAQLRNLKVGQTQQVTDQFG
jgi:hypothetical protein